MTTLRHMTERDQAPLQWDWAEARSAGTFDAAALRKARERFEAHVNGGGTVLYRKPGEQGFKRASSFEDLREAEEATLVPRVVGG